MTELIKKRPEHLKALFDGFHELNLTDKLKDLWNKKEKI